MKKKIAIITDFRFWEQDSGSKNRTLHLLRYLDRFFRMDIVYLDRFDAAARERADALGLQSRIVDLGAVRPVRKREVYRDEPELKAHTHPLRIDRLNAFLLENSADIIINTNIRTHAYVQNLPYDVLKIIDLHDLMHMRSRSFQAHHAAEEITLSAAREFEIIDTYDHILAIQQNEYEICCRHLAPEKVHLVPHASNIRNVYTSKQAIRSVGYIATDNPSNSGAIEWFLKQVWIWHNAFPSLTLHIYGSIVNRFEAPDLPFVHLAGHVDDLQEVYRNSDIMINPVRFGSGLKIKNVEALIHAIPLVTTSVGAQGMEEGGNNAFLQADTPQEWCQALTALSLSGPLRDTLSRNATVFSEKKFSTSACYDGLVALLKSAGA